MAIHKAAASCATEGQIWDITDPANPGTLNPVHVDDPGVNSTSCGTTRASPAPANRAATGGSASTA
jgi:hypothetical protein